MRRVILIDEASWHTFDAHSIWVKHWEQENRADNLVPTLVEALIQKLPEATDGDLRTITKGINAELKDVPRRALPVYKTVDAQDGYTERYPQRPGGQICQFYADTGHCRYVPAPPCTLSYIQPFY